MVSDQALKEENSPIEEAKSRWAGLLGNYHDEAAHQRFVYFCQKNDLLPLAAQLYNARLKADENDPITVKYRKQIQVISQFNLTPKTGDGQDYGADVDNRIKKWVVILVVIMVAFVLLGTMGYVFMSTPATP